jgi:hypothetical protein
MKPMITPTATAHVRIQVWLVTIHSELTASHHRAHLDYETGQ